MTEIRSNIRIMEFLVNYVHISTAFENFTTEDETCLTFSYLDYFQICVKQSEYESSPDTKTKNCMFTTYDTKSTDENELIVNVYKMCSSVETYIGQSIINLESVFKKSFAPQQATSVNGSNSSLQATQYPLTESTRLILPIVNDENLRLGTINVHVSVTSFGPSLIYQSPVQAMAGVPEKPHCADRLQENNLKTSNEISPSTCSNHACTYVSDGRQLQPQNLSPKDESLPVFRTAPKENIEEKSVCAGNVPEINTSNEISQSTCGNHTCTNVSDDLQQSQHRSILCWPCLPKKSQNLSPNDERIPLLSPAPKDNIEEKPASAGHVPEINTSNEMLRSTCSYHTCTYVSDGLQSNSQGLSPNFVGIPLVTPASKDKIEAEFQEKPFCVDRFQENDQKSSNDLSPSTCNANCFYRPMNPSADLQLNSQYLSPNDDSIPLVPTPSKDNIKAPENGFEEYCAEVNDNVLIVRLAKANRKVRRVCDEMECVNYNICNNNLKQFNMMCSDDGENLIVECPKIGREKHTKSCGVPAINGNLKHMESKQNKFDNMHGSNCAAGIEVCNTGCQNPNYDVFVIKLGKTKGTRSEIELELRTPKGPTARVPLITQTAQTYEEEFKEEYNGNKQVDKLETGILIYKS